MQSVVPVIFAVVILVGCGGGGGSGDNSSNGGNPSGGGGTGGGGNNGNPTPVPPAVVSAAPQGGAVSVHAAVEITFSKPMKLSSFLTALDGLGVGYEAVCVEADCKTIRFNRQNSADLRYETPYTLTLSTQVLDQEGNPLSSPYQWSFTTAPFVPPPSFIEGIAIDGLNGKDSGECTALAIDSSGTIHIVYYSEEDGSPKHAFCSPNEDCSDPTKWKNELIDSPVLQDQKLGRDINLAIDGNILHVSYRDIDNQPGRTGSGILKYARGEKDSNGPGWIWSSVIVDDTDFGVTDTYIAVNAGSVHISYRKKGATSGGDALTYATCSASCDSTSPWVDKVEIDHGNEAGAPNHIVVTPNSAIHISYYLDGKLSYVTCDTPNGCDPFGDVQTNWERVIIDDGGADHFDVGTENSLAVDGNVIHITYRDNSNGLLKYARCDTDCNVSPSHWQKAAIDAAGGSSQIKVDDGDLHISYRDDANKDLKYAKCFTNCLNPESWSIQTIDAPGEVGLDTYLEVKSGVVHISYRDAGNKDLKYVRGSAVP